VIERAVALQWVGSIRSRGLMAHVPYDQLDPTLAASSPTVGSRSQLNQHEGFIPSFQVPSQLWYLNNLFTYKTEPPWRCCPSFAIMPVSDVYMYNPSRASESESSLTAPFGHRRLGSARPLTQISRELFLLISLGVTPG